MRPPHWLSYFTRWAQHHHRAFLAWLAVSRLALLPLRVWLIFLLPYRSEYLFWWDTLDYFGRQGAFPYLHYWSEYPPVMPWLMAGLYHVSAWWFDGLARQACFFVLYGLLLIAAELGVLALLFGLAQRCGQPAAEVGVIAYAVAGLPLYLWAGWWDNLPLLFLLAGWLLLLDGRHKRSALLAGVGVMTKMFPVLLLPLAVSTLPTWRRKIIYGLAFLACVAALVLPLALGNPTMTLASFQNIVSRPSWETVWALLDGYYGYGTVAALPDRLMPTSARQASHTSPLPWGAITLFFGGCFAGLYLFVWTRHRRQQGEARLLTAALALSMCLLLLYSKGYSPQYLFWLAPFLVVAYPTRRMAAMLGVLFVVNLIELPVYINLFPDQVWLLYGTVGVRTGLLLWIAALLAAELLRGWRERHASVPAVPA
jgi:hypothetical protein